MIFIFFCIFRNVLEKFLKLIHFFILKWDCNVMIGIPVVIFICKMSIVALAGVAQWIEHGLQTKGLPVQFPLRAHAWVVGQVPSMEHTRDNHTLMFLFLSSSLPSSLSRNK